MNQTVTVSALAWQAGVPTIWWGEPGTGKTAVAHAMAFGLGWNMEVVIASIREPSDMNGLPAITKDGVQFTPPSWVKRIIERDKTGQTSIVFFDELSTAAPATQAGVLRVIHERVAGDEQMPMTTAMAAAANPPEHAAGGWELSAPLANRFHHSDWSVSATDWVDGMLSGFPTPEVPRLKAGWDAIEPLTRASVGAFIRHRPTLMLQVPTSQSEAGKAWPSPRTWTMAARLMAAAKAAGYEDLSDVTMHSVAGCVGAGPAAEFLTWVRENDLPDPEEILAKPDRFKLPTRSDRQFAVLASVSAAVVSNTTPERWLAGWKVMAKAATDGPKDVAAASSAALLRLAKKRPDLPLPTQEIRAFIPLLKAAGVLPS